MTLLSARIQRIVAYLCCGFTLLMSASCVTSEGFTTAPRDDFEALWRIFDRHYCFFDYKKQEYGLDWNEVHQRYAAQVSDSMSPQASCVTDMSISGHPKTRRATLDGMRLIQ